MRLNATAAVYRRRSSCVDAVCRDGKVQIARVLEPEDDGDFLAPSFGLGSRLVGNPPLRPRLARRGLECCSSLRCLTLTESTPLNHGGLSPIIRRTRWERRGGGQ